MPTHHPTIPALTPDQEQQRFIVAEVSKNYHDGQEVTPNGPLCLLFEQVIAVNLARGFKLHSFHLSQVSPTPLDINETILAVFERITH